MFSGIDFFQGMTQVVLLVLCGVSGFSYGFAGGTGEPNDPYRIASAEQLVSIGFDPNLLDKCFVLVNDIDLDPNLPNGRVFGCAVVAADVNDAWNGFDGTPFTGALDGAGFAISNLTVHGSEHLGLFGVIGPRGVVRNLSVRNAEISRQKMGWDFIGTLAGQNEGTITNCHITTAISFGELPALLQSTGGGLVGVNIGTLAQCSACVRMTGCFAYVGGLVGSNGGAGIVSACRAEGQVTCNAGFIGGLIGVNGGLAIG